MTEFRLDDLYNVEAEVSLPDGSAVVVRVLTEAEVQERDQAALEAYAKVREEMTDEEGEMHQKVIAPLLKEDTPREALIWAAAAVQQTRLGLEAARQYPMQFFPFPENASTEERIDVMRQQDKHEASVRQARAESVERKIQAYVEGLQERDDAALRRIATQSLIEGRCEVARAEEFQVQTVHLATREGDSKGPPRWPVETVRQHGKKGGLSDRVYSEILAIYFRLDTADPWEMQKKL